MNRIFDISKRNNFITKNMNISSNKVTETFKIEGDWNQYIVDLKLKYPQLTDEDFQFNAGEEEDLIKRLEVRLHKNTTEVIKIIKKVRAI